MNVVITLPKDLLEKILSGKKQLEMRKCMPKYLRVGEDGFYVVEKGTDNVRCWCRVDEFVEIYFDYYNVKWFRPHICVPEKYIMDYAKGKKVYLWKIGKVKTFDYLKRSDLLVDRNPQSFCYTYSKGEPLF